jgi:hypothetical protein
MKYLGRGAVAAIHPFLSLGLMLSSLSVHSLVHDILFGLMQALDTPVTLDGSAYLAILLDGLARGMYTIYINTSTSISILTICSAYGQQFLFVKLLPNAIEKNIDKKLFQSLHT